MTAAPQAEPAAGSGDPPSPRELSAPELRAALAAVNVALAAAPGHHDLTYMRDAFAAELERRGRESFEPVDGTVIEDALEDLFQ